MIKKIWYTKSIDIDNIEDGNPLNGSIVFSFKQGSSLYIGFEELEYGDKKDTSFIQHLALSMLPPFLPSIVDITANWLHEGWHESKNLSQESLDGVDKILDAWQGLVMNEGVVGQAIRRSVLDSIEEGIIVNSKWYDCESYEQVRNSLDDVAGSNEERELAAHIARMLQCWI